MLKVDISLEPNLTYLKAWIISIENAAVKDLSVFFSKWALPIVIEEFARLFDTNGYGTWKQLTPRYKTWKDRFYPTKPILRRTDVYYRALTLSMPEGSTLKSIRRKSGGNLYEVNPDSLLYGIDEAWFASRFGAPYPVFLEKGTPNMASRPVFAIIVNQNLNNALLAALVDYLKKAITKETTRYFKSSS